jgi:hypothetical protein
MKNLRADGFAYENIITSTNKIIKIRAKINTPELFIKQAPLSRCFERRAGTIVK